MIHLIIDTSTLLQLSNTDGFNSYLIQLENLVNNKEVSLISHKLTVEEWERNKEKDRKQKERKLLFDKSQSESSNFKTSTLPEKLIRNVDHLKLQYELIEKLLASATVLTTPDIIDKEFAYRYRKRLAPFHKKLIELGA